VPTIDDLSLARFSGRRVLVVGGSTGIGAAVARRLAAEGAELVVTDLDEAACDAVVTTLAGSGHRTAAIDVTSRASVEAAVSALDRLDVLVHVSGGDRAHPAFVETDDRVWTELLELNLLGVVRTCRATAPLLLAGELGPAVVVVGSVNAVVALGSEPYSAAKAGVVSLVANLAVELAPRVRVNAVLPATVTTRVWDDQPGGAEQLRRLYPLDRVGRPEDVAAAAAFLASDDAAWVTGHALPVDGGLLTGGALRRLLA
jgi:meso-butanediol dehydrogenase/(S,S)-butanediol dehydrogenase/diacetyl reductase